jgi:hypothetical protein
MLHVVGSADDKVVPFNVFKHERVFVRVYELPTKLTGGYCGSSGVPICFLNVDWFEAAPNDREGLEVFIRGKRYYDAAKTYLVLADDPRLTFTLGRPVAR